MLTRPFLVLWSLVLICYQPLLAQHEPPNLSELERSGAIRYPDGEKLTERFFRPPANLMTMADGRSEVSTEAMAAAVEGFEGITLRAKEAILLPTADVAEVPPGLGLEAQREAVAESGAKEEASYQEFDVLYDGRYPIARANRAVFSVDQKAQYIRDRNLPQARLAVAAIEPTVDYQKARNVALSHATEVFTKLYPDCSDPLLEVAADSDELPHFEVLPSTDLTSGALAWSFRVVSFDPRFPFARNYWISATGEPTVLDFEDRVFFEHDLEMTPADDEGCCTNSEYDAEPTLELGEDVDMESPAVPVTRGRVLAEVWAASPRGARRFVPLANVNVTVRSGLLIRTARTNAVGRYVVPGLGGRVFVSANLRGPHVRVVNTAGTSLSQTVTGIGVVNIIFRASAEFDLSQTTAYFGTNRARGFVSRFLPTNPTKLDNMLVNVNINSTCNAFYSPSNNSTNYFRAASVSSCPNTAYIDVICHEYGHAVDDQLGGIVDGGYSEGFGDTLTQLITRQPIVGRDFFAPGNHLRDATRAPKWPTVSSSGVHAKGWAYSGFVYELINNLERQYHSRSIAYAVAKKLLLTTGVQNPRSVPDAVRLSFVVDRTLYPHPIGRSRHFGAIRAAALFAQIPIPFPATEEDAEIEAAAAAAAAIPETDGLQELIKFSN